MKYIEMKIFVEFCIKYANQVKDNIAKLISTESLIS